MKITMGIILDKLVENNRLRYSSIGNARWFNVNDIFQAFHITNPEEIEKEKKLFNSSHITMQFIHDDQPVMSLYEDGLYKYIFTSENENVKKYCSATIDTLRKFDTNITFRLASKHPVVRFLNETCSFSESKGTQAFVLHNQYCNWAKVKKTNKLTQNQFFNDLRSLGIEFNFPASTIEGLDCHWNS